MHGVSQVMTGQWYPTQTVVPEHVMTGQMSEAQQALLTGDISVLLSVVVEFGKIGLNGETVEVKYAGCGKVMAVR